MVVSKDSKRKRKESSTPTQQQQQQSSSTIESSPEMPKRTKVQAQRKFAQGQSAPQSSYSSIIASSSSNTGPSTSSESREPPTEILPNKRPKTEDFLTFLCFRGTSALPPHLDFLNQGRSREPPRPVRKSPNKRVNKKGKKTKSSPTKTVKIQNYATDTKQNNETHADSNDGDEDEKTENIKGNNAIDQAGVEVQNKEAKRPTTCDEVPTYAVRKRADIVVEGNRRNNATSNNKELDKCSNSTEGNVTKRSSRSVARDARVILDPLPKIEADHPIPSTSVQQVSSKTIQTQIDTNEQQQQQQRTGISKTCLKTDRKSETPSKESESTTDRSRKGNRKKDAETKNVPVKEMPIKPEIRDVKIPIKRSRQKESPIFIPSPEPSGRMTRQRAFFEPVKVLPKEAKQQHLTNANEKSSEQSVKGSEINLTDEHNNKDESVSNKKVEPKPLNVKREVNDTKKSNLKNNNDDVNKLKTDLNVFDFSSDDEQPLAKAMKFKKGGGGRSGRSKKIAQRGNKKSSGNKIIEKAETKEKEKGDVSTKQNEINTKALEVERKEEPLSSTTNKGKGKRATSTVNSNAKNSKLKRDSDVNNDQQSTEELINDKDLITPTSPKKTMGYNRPGRKKIKGGDSNNEGAGREPETEIENPNSPPPVRAQRPSRKTKEAATIYMGIIGHRLQLGDDEDDDISLSSFDRPNVREMEKMENELKRNAALSGKQQQSQNHESSPVPSKQMKNQTEESSPPTAASVSVSSNEKINTGRRGRPPKNQKQPTTLPLPPPVKREIEGMLVKKGALAKMAHQQSMAVATENLFEIKNINREASKSVTNEDDEDFLLNEELNETKRKLEKSFSDSDDEPLAIKAHIKPGERDDNSVELVREHHHLAATVAVTGPQSMAQPAVATNISTLTMLPLTTKPITTAPTPPPPTTTLTATMASALVGGGSSAIIPSSPTAAPNIIFPAAPVIPPSPFKVIEKKSPVPTSKILNVPATYGIPPASPTGVMPSSMANSFGKTPMYVPQSPAHYHSHIRPTSNIPPPLYSGQQTQTKSAAAVAAVSSSTAANSPHLNASAQTSSLKYQTPPTTYPPPIEAYPSPKINPNFLTPKFDRNTLPRHSNLASTHNSFTSPSPVKFDMPTTTLLKNSQLSQAIATSVNSKNMPSYPCNIIANNLATASTSSVAATTAVAAAVAAAANINANASNSDPLKDEIGSILAANLMPSKEESGKIFGIASVSLAQSSGPDNTKCTLGKCGSIHKPVLGPVVPTESYIGDQLSGKERRKAKVNMTHEQIHKWLIECSSNPDEIQDDLDDDFDSDLRPNNYSTTPPPTRDDKESTSFSSSSKATRDLGKSESAWSAKGPSLKATPVVATNSGNGVANNSRTKDDAKLNEAANSPHEDELDKTSPILNIMSREKAAINKQTTSSPISIEEKPLRNTDRKPERKHHHHNNKDEKTPTVKETMKHSEKDSTPNTTKTGGGAYGKQIMTTAHQKVTNQKKVESPVDSPTTTTTTSTAANKSNRKKAAAEVVNTEPSPARPGEQSLDVNADNVNRTPKRMPVYQQKQATKHLQTCELKETTTTSHKKSAPFSYGGAFSADNEKSIYSFDKDDDHGNEAEGTTNHKSAVAYWRQQHLGDESTVRDTIRTPTPTPACNTTTPTTNQQGRAVSKKRSSAAVVEKANKELTNAATQQQISSVSLTLSPTEKSKLVKVSLDADAVMPGKPLKGSTTKSGSGERENSVGAGKDNKRNAETVTANNEADSNDSADGHTFYIPLQGIGASGEGEGGIQGVAVKLGREGPDGPNQKVIMHATLVTKAQMGANPKPLPESMNVSDIVKNLMNSDKKSTPSTSAAAAATITATAPPTPNSASNSLKNVPIGTVQPRFKGETPQPSTSTSAMAGGNLVRVNSNSSLLSGSVKSRNVAAGASGSAGQGVTSYSSNKKFKDDTPIKMANNTAFPRHDDPTQMVEAPIFRPTEKEFADPIEFIERITPIAARFGICKIIPPISFKPECRISDEMRFTAYNQYVHKMLHRWGPSAKELSAIKKYLATQSIVMNHPPWIGGMEVDLPRLYHTVQELGGLKEVIEKKKWARVAEEMCIPKLAQDRVTKLDDIYCKYLLPYDTLSPAERQKLFDEVEADWAKREARARRNADRFVNTESVSNEDDDVTSENDEEESEEEVDGVSMECIVKGRSMPLSQFYRIARNTMALWFKNAEPIVNEVEAEFWRHVAVRDSHVCVHSGSIDSSGWGYGFPSPGPKGKGSNYARHPWNLKVMTNNPGSVLRSLGPVMGVTVPTLHVGMLFSACCWYRDPHGLSWIEYLHTGASKLWYGIPDDQSANFRAALTSLIPTHCQNKTIWLPCDTVMVPPHMLTDRGVSLCRIEQKPGEFIVVFPRAYTSSLATGYVVSESVYFATSSWLDLAKDDFRDIHDSCEPAMFSLEQLLFALGYDQRVPPDALQQMLPMLQEVYEKETAAREQLKAAGVTSTEKVTNEKGGKSKKQQLPPYKSIESECDLCRANLYISMVRTDEGSVYCLQHALKNLNNGNIQAKKCKLIYAYNVDDIENLIRTLKERMQQKRNTNAGKKQK